MKQLTLILLLLFTLHLYAQKRATVISGHVKSDSLSVENIHIINKTSKKGTISNHKGEYEIAVQLNDTLLFSGIQFYLYEIKVTDSILKSKLLEIDLFQKINTLDEIIVKKPGNIFLLQEYTYTINAVTLGLPNAGKKLPDPIDRKLSYLGSGLYRILSGERKKLQKLRKLMEEDEKIKKIRLHFHDYFFLNTIKIPKEKINIFIKFSLSKQLEQLFKKDRNLEVMEIFIKKGKKFYQIN